MSPLALLLRRFAYAYATQEQFRRHSAAHSSPELMFPRSTNLSGTFMLGIAMNASPSPPHGGSA
jgi:hypothetical protein